MKGLYWKQLLTYLQEELLLKGMVGHWHLEEEVVATFVFALEAICYTCLLLLLCYKQVIILVKKNTIGGGWLGTDTW